MRNPKSEIRNKHQIQMRNSQNPTNQPTGGGLVLRTCSFAHWNLFRISDFGFQISDLARHCFQSGGVQQKKMWVRTSVQAERAGARGPLLPSMCVFFGAS